MTDPEIAEALAACVQSRVWNAEAYKDFATSARTALPRALEALKAALAGNQTLRAEVERLTKALVEIKSDISQNMDCNDADEIEEENETLCSGDDCVKCWIERSIDAALSPAKPEGEER